MKYRKVYDVLERRRQQDPKLRITDRSGWRSYAPSHIDRCRPLWLIIEDPAAGRRYWITHDKPNMEIAYQQMDAAGRNAGDTTFIRCNNMADMAAKLEKLFREGHSAA